MWAAANAGAGLVGDVWQGVKQPIEGITTAAQGPLRSSSRWVVYERRAALCLTSAHGLSTTHATRQRETA